MAIKLVEIVNPNGRKGLVAATSAAAAAYKQPPSVRTQIVEIPDGAPDEDWTNAQLTSYAVAHDIDTTSLGSRPTKADLLGAFNAAAAGLGARPLNLDTQPSTPTTNESQED